MQYCLMLTYAFQLLNVGTAPRSMKNDKDTKALSSSRATASAASSKPNKKQERPRREVPFCLYELHKSRGIRRLLKYCKQSPEE